MSKRATSRSTRAAAGRPAAAGVTPKVTPPPKVTPLPEVVGRFSPAMAPLLVPIASVRPDSQNARKHDDRNLDAIARSLKRFGQQTPIVVDAGGVIRKGNGTWTAAIVKLGWSHIAAVRTDLDGEKLRAYAVADNRSGDKEVGSTWDDAMLAQTLRDLDQLEGADAGLALDAGFNADELEAMLGMRELEGGSGGASDKAVDLGSAYQVVIDCGSERDQQQVFEAIKPHGWKVRLLTVHGE